MTGDAKDGEVLLADGDLLYDICAGRNPHHPLHGVDVTEYLGDMGRDHHLRILPWDRGHKLFGGIEYIPFGWHGRQS